MASTGLLGLCWHPWWDAIMFFGTVPWVWATHGYLLRTLRVRDRQATTRFISARIHVRDLAFPLEDRIPLPAGTASCMNREIHSLAQD